MKSAVILLTTLLCLGHFGHCLPSCPGIFRALSTGNYATSAVPGGFLTARAFCKSLGAYVANITTVEEYSAIRQELITESIGSVWVSGQNRPELFTRYWRDMYAEGEPDHTGYCFYLSNTYNYKWKDTNCFRQKKALCERDDCEVSTVQEDDVFEDEEPDNNESEVGVKAIQEQCKTVIGMPCALPFHFEGVTYDKCTTIGDFEEKPWCSLGTDSEGNHSGPYNWAYCDMETCKS